MQFSGNDEERKENRISGGNGEREPPVPIPNTEVKPLSAESTWLETARENRTLPDSKRLRRKSNLRNPFFCIQFPRKYGWYTDNWDCISPMFKFSQTARKVSGFRRLNRSRTVFPNAVDLTKALYLATW